MGRPNLHYIFFSRTESYETLKNRHLKKYIHFHKKGPTTRIYPVKINCCSTPSDCSSWLTPSRVPMSPRTKPGIVPPQKRTIPPVRPCRGGSLAHPSRVSTTRRRFHNSYLRPRSLTPASTGGDQEPHSCSALCTSWIAQMGITIAVPRVV